MTQPRRRSKRPLFTGMGRGRLLYTGRGAALRWTGARGILPSLMHHMHVYAAVFTVVVVFWAIHVGAYFGFFTYTPGPDRKAFVEYVAASIDENPWRIEGFFSPYADPEHSLWPLKHIRYIDSPRVRERVIGSDGLGRFFALSLLKDERAMPWVVQSVSHTIREYTYAVLSQLDPDPYKETPEIWARIEYPYPFNYPGPPTLPAREPEDILLTWNWDTPMDHYISLASYTMTRPFPRKGLPVREWGEEVICWYIDHLGTPVLDWDFEYLDSDEDRTRGTEFNFIYSRSWFERHRIPVLLKMLKDEPNPMLKEHMAVKLFRRGMVEAIPTLDAAVKTKTEPLAQRRMMTFLVNCVEYLPVPDNPDWDYEPGGFQRSEESGFRDYIPPHWRDKITPEEAAAISRDYAEVLKWWDFNRDRIEYENGLWVVGKNK